MRGAHKGTRRRARPPTPKSPAAAGSRPGTSSSRPTPARSRKSFRAARKRPTPTRQGRACSSPSTVSAGTWPRRIAHGKASACLRRRSGITPPPAAASSARFRGRRRPRLSPWTVNMRCTEMWPFVGWEARPPKIRAASGSMIWRPTCANGRSMCRPTWQATRLPMAATIARRSVVAAGGLGGVATSRQTRPAPVRRTAATPRTDAPQVYNGVRCAR
jgi:hypothetical protein